MREPVLGALRGAAIEQLIDLTGSWSFWARPEQLAPKGVWRTWLFLGGRGAGKTRAGAEWIRSQVESGRLARIALVGPTLADVREVMIDGASGLRSLGPRADAPRYEPSRRRLIWPNGAVAYVFSAEDPDALRGPQFSAAWLDEFAAWRDPQAVFDMLQFGLRLGDAPRQVVTTTPRPIPSLKALIAAEGTVTTRAPTAANIAHLAPGFVQSMSAAYARSLLGRQELFGELVDDIRQGLWSRALIDSVFAAAPGAMDRIVVAVDPPAGGGATSSACGIIVAGAGGQGLKRRAWVLADRTIQGVDATTWARRAVEAAREFDADRIVAEVNQGGDMVRAVLQIVEPSIRIDEVRATVSKRARAMPVHTLYEARRVFHAGRFALLEDEMCAFDAPGPRRLGVDRVDALVWAVTALIRDAQALPRLSRL